MEHELGEVGEQRIEFAPEELSKAEEDSGGATPSQLHEVRDLHLVERIRGMAAKLIVFGFHGKTVNDHARRLIRSGAGGVIIFSRNFESLEQISELCCNLKREAGRRPLLIMVDQEGGRVMRLGPPFTRIPSPKLLGSVGCEKTAHRVGSILGRELRAVNIDMDLAPVVDVNTNPENPVIGDRAFGSTTAIVCQMAYDVIRGMQLEGVAACAKHFPGHGDSSVDSHLALPTLTHSLERLRKVELPPFKTAVEADVAAVMVAHLAVPALASCPEDTSRPATLSRGAVSELRVGLRFDGLILSDCLEMGAIVKGYTVPGAAVLALQAGVDMLIISHTEERQVGAIKAIEEALLRGRLTMDRLEEAGKRVDQVVQMYCQAPFSKSDPLESSFALSRHELVGCGEHVDFVCAIKANISS